MPYALKVGCLAFDSTPISAADVDFPIDVVLYERDSFALIEQRYEKRTSPTSRTGGTSACGNLELRIDAADAAS
jgi:hypothetical protein